MKYTIDSKSDGLDIAIEDVKDKQEKMLEAFQACQQGRCSCPTNEYQKLDDIDIEQSHDGIQIHLTSKPGVHIDQAEIEKCLDYTEQRIESEDDQ